MREFKGNRKIKKIGLLCLLLLLFMTAAACNRQEEEGPGGQNQPSDPPSSEPTAAEQEPAATRSPEVTSGPAEGEKPDPVLTPALTQKPDPTVTPALTPKPTLTPAPTKKPGVTAAPAPTEKPAPTAEPSPLHDFVPSEKVIHAATALRQGDYLFYKTGTQTRTVITARNLKTSKETEIITIQGNNSDITHAYLDTGEIYLKGSNLYYHADGDIYRVGVDGKNNIRLFKGKATILGIHDEDVIALDRKAREVIRISSKAEKKTLVKIKSIDSLEAAMLKDGIYYINKSSNAELDGQDTMDRLYYIDFDGKNKMEIHAEQDIYNLKSNGKEMFFVAAGEQEAMLKKIENHMAVTLYSITKEEAEDWGIGWFVSDLVILGADASRVYYGMDETKIYSIGTDGEGQSLFLDAAKIEGINPAAYFSRGRLAGNYLKVVFDCDEDPIETYLIDLQDQSALKFEGSYYLANAIDAEGEYIYYCKSSKPDPYGELQEEYKYSRMKISELK